MQAGRIFSLTFWRCSLIPWSIPLRFGPPSSRPPGQTLRQPGRPFELVRRPSYCSRPSCQPCWLSCKSGYVVLVASGRFPGGLTLAAGGREPRSVENQYRIERGGGACAKDRRYVYAVRAARNGSRCVGTLFRFYVMCRWLIVLATWMLMPLRPKRPRRRPTLARQAWLTNHKPRSMTRRKPPTTVWTLPPFQLRQGKQGPGVRLKDLDS